MFIFKIRHCKGRGLYRIEYTTYSDKTVILRIYDCIYEYVQKDRDCYQVDIEGHLVDMNASDFETCFETNKTSLN